MAKSTKSGKNGVCDGQSSQNPQILPFQTAKVHKVHKIAAFRILGGANISVADRAV
jgi:hypothetical protein